jgi:hypothetical protein
LPRPPLEHDAEALHLAVERLAGDAEGFGGVGGVAASAAEERFDLFLFAVYRGGGAGRRRLTEQI